MVIVDTALARRESTADPVRVALVGAGVTGRMIALQLATPIPGIRLVAVANRTVDKGIQAFGNAGVADVTVADSVAAVEARVERGQPVVAADATLVCAAGNIDVIVEVTGTVEFGARVAMDAIRHRKHVVLVNAELDATIGPILRVYAQRAGVVITNTDGDEPGVAMTLLRYVKSIGLRPVAAGNLKGMIDPYRTPDTQREFAAKYNQDAAKVTSFADGTKLSMEATILANATGFRVGQRGMFGPRCAHVKEIAALLPAADLAYYKMGEGPFYVFYTPYHLPHVQIASTIGRAALFQDATVTPLGAPVCEVAALAKRDLKAGETLDGVGGFTTYGVIENADTFAAQGLLAMGVAEGARLLRDVPKDTPISAAHVALPEGRICDRLRAEQTARFATATEPSSVRTVQPLLA
jgi:predicted homoserine dehydrogenase-like protein